MLEAQYYTLIILEIDVNNILIDIQNGNIDNTAQHP